MFIKRGKRGISPLIATVLLIAFAVAIGVMIINLGGKSSKNAGDCTDVNMELQIINSKPVFCYDTLSTQIRFMVKNTGTVDIDELRLLVTSSDLSIDKVQVGDSALKAGDIEAKSSEYVKAGTFKTEIVPVITYAGKQIQCIDKSIASDDLDKCG